jgi:hypothetical protein
LINDALSTVLMYLFNWTGVSLLEKGPALILLFFNVLILAGVVDVFLDDVETGPR